MAKTSHSENRQGSPRGKGAINPIVPTTEACRRLRRRGSNSSVPVRLPGELRSWRGQTVTLGKPCLGGYGTDMYAMRPDGSHVTRLTMPGSSFEPPGVLYDNYHPAWSPDGTQLGWTHVSFEPETNSGTQWTMLVADFAQHGDNAPRLENVMVVGPGGNTAYETQPWAPDGSGFLYTLFTAPNKPPAG
jgi:hypothetical protein